MKVKYLLNWNKAVETIVWLAYHKAGLDVYHILKLLFFAEKKHINRYARPITGDIYFRLEHGPVASSIWDLAKGNEFVHPVYLKALNQSVDIEYPHSFTAKREPCLDYFSKTELECLQEALEEYGDKSFDELWNLSHQEECWLKADANQPIDYILMIDEDNPLKEDIVREMQETSMYLAL